MHEPDQRPTILRIYNVSTLDCMLALLYDQNGEIISQAMHNLPFTNLWKDHQSCGNQNLDLSSSHHQMMHLPKLYKQFMQQHFSSILLT